MSWDSYIDNMAGRCSGSMDKGAIIGFNGSLWTSHGPENALKLTADEAMKIGKALESKDYSPFQASGIYVEGVKYQFLRGDDSIALGKKKDHGSITMQATKTAVIIGHTKEGGNQGNTNIGVGAIAEYIEGLGM